MEKLTLKEACKIFRKCTAMSTTECESCILTKVEDENGKDLCILFGNIEDAIINYNRNSLAEEEHIDEYF